VRILALIPARGGSKGIPRKNLRLLAGRPLLAWSIDAAYSSPMPGHERRVVVSTDDAEIALEAVRVGAEIIMRPDELATDEAATDPVIVHAVETLKADGWRPDIVVLLQPTVPVRAPGLIRACIQRLIDTGADSVLTGYPLHFVWWNESPAYRYDEGKPGGSGRPEPPMWRSQCPRRPRRQDMEARELMWAEDGNVYVTRTELLELKGTRLGGHQEMVETARTVDIDTEEDFAVAEAMMALRDRSAVSA
jgi:CMP-N,N'-diacetyllegionaminic acid synthase